MNKGIGIAASATLQEPCLLSPSKAPWSSGRDARPPARAVWGSERLCWLPQAWGAGLGMPLPVDHRIHQVGKVLEDHQVQPLPQHCQGHH